MKALRRGLIAMLVAVAAVVGIVWVVPTFAGPIVDCGPLDPVTCEEEWQLMVPPDEGRFEWWPPPITRVEVLEAGGGGCGIVRIQRWIFGQIAINDC